VSFLAVGFTTASAPWWFVAALAGGLTIVSTVTGALVGYLSTAASDRRRAEQDLLHAQRENEEADNRRLREAVAKYLVEARGLVRTYFDNRTDDGTDGNVPLPRVENFQPSDIRPAYEAYWAVVFVSNPEIARASRKLLELTRAFDVDKTFGPLRDLTRTDARELWREHVEARGALVRSTLKQLGRENDIS
jgi:hypothetical protein